MLQSAGFASVNRTYAVRLFKGRAGLWQRGTALPQANITLTAELLSVKRAGLVLWQGASP
jgi:hypothetical protein